MACQNQAVASRFQANYNILRHKRIIKHQAFATFSGPISYSHIGWPASQRHRLLQDRQPEREEASVYVPRHQMAEVENFKIKFTKDVTGRETVTAADAQLRHGHAADKYVSPTRPVRAGATAEGTAALGPIGRSRGVRTARRRPVVERAALLVRRVNKCWLRGLASDVVSNSCLHANWSEPCPFSWAARSDDLPYTGKPGCERVEPLERHSGELTSGPASAGRAAASRR
jgi:hypothetical protein